MVFKINCFKYLAHSLMLSRRRRRRSQPLFAGQGPSGSGVYPRNTLHKVWIHPGFSYSMYQVPACFWVVWGNRRTWRKLRVTQGEHAITHHTELRLEPKLPAALPVSHILWCVFKSVIYIYNHNSKHLFNAAFLFNTIFCVHMFSTHVCPQLFLSKLKYVLNM